MASVYVRLYDTQGRPIDGTVTLARHQHSPYSCRTVAGRCTVQGVPPGVYRVTVRPVRGEVPPSQVLTVPRGGRGVSFVARVRWSGRSTQSRAALVRENVRLKFENALLKMRLRGCR